MGLKKKAAQYLQNVPNQNFFYFLFFIIDLMFFFKSQNLPLSRIIHAPKVAIWLASRKSILLFLYRSQMRPKMSSHCAIIFLQCWPKLIRL
jgi:hypothetical protein